VLCGEPSQALPELWQWDGVLKHLPQGVAVIDPEFRIQWCNERLSALTGRKELVGVNFLESFGAPEIVGPDFLPFHSNNSIDDTCTTTLRVGEKTFFEVVGAPVYVDGKRFPRLAVVTVRDVSSEMIVRQKLKAIYQAGLEMGELSAEDLVELSVEERVELLKQKIIQFTKDVLEFETIEIRLVDKRTNELEQLLHVGMGEEAAKRKLFAERQGNGVTGYVAATGASYLCPDTSRDPLYLPGAPNARSSLTVPLMLHDQILGTFNVESAQVNAFTQHDQQFLELFCREVALALNTLELLVAEKLTAATENTDLILREIAQPVDEILNDTAWILERYIGHDPAVSERLQRVLKHTRSVRQLVHRVGETLAPRLANPPMQLRPQRPKLRQKRVLVVDNDEMVRIAAHELLGRFGCEVETAHHGDEALLMVRSFHYDVAILDIRLPDMTGFDCFVKIREINEHLPVILMTGFGYDPAHSIVKARQMGLKSVLYKPFRLDQLLKEVENNVAEPEPAA
jgi:CheY-like chemotaxis protein/PAS domain-containing protein